MLSELYIENIALIKKASVMFDTGLNVLTGETGAGKTILIGAIEAVLGERISRDIIRTGEKKAVVTALFRDISAGAVDFLTDAGYPPDEDGSLIVQREISSSGNTCRVGGAPATVASLKQIGSRLLAIHGQFDTQALADSESHRGFIDAFGELDGDIAKYRAVYDELMSVREKLSQTRMDEAQKAQRVDFLNYQINEISQQNFVAGEEDNLTARRDIIRNAEKISKAIGEAINLLDGDESQGACDAALDAAEQISRVSRYLQGADALTERLRAAGYELRDICDTLRDQMSDAEYDGGELDSIEGRLDIINRLGHKYGGGTAEMLERLDKLRSELDEILFSDEHMKKLEAKEAELHGKAVKLANALTGKRTSSGEVFSKNVETELAELDMPTVRLLVKVSPRELGPSGGDHVEIFFSANRGEELRPLSKIASGGEMSRVMLSIKNVLSGKDDIDTLIFDEIDSGVSGRAAHKIGGKLKKASRARQILCVTHLSQVAAFADRHLLIAKQADEKATFTKVEILDDEGRAKELARITGGEEITDIALQNAREMLMNARAN